MTESILSSLESLRSEGAHRFDPVRFRYLEALSQRMQQQTAGVQQVLADKLQVALKDYAERFSQAQKSVSDDVASLASQHPALARELRKQLAAGDHREVRRLSAKAAFQAQPQAKAGPLTELNQYIQSLMQDSSHALPDRVATNSPAEMKSVQRFSEVWSRIAAENMVDQAVEKGPENAGPLNSHMLMLRSLTLMRDLSPDYLRRFLAHAEALLWLDQANQKNVLADAKPASRARAKK